MILIPKDKILELIPQRPPMVMIDNLIESTKDYTVSNFFIDENSLFCENGYFSEFGLIENIAQTAAARMGYQCMIFHEKVKKGFIGAIKNLKVSYLPQANTQIITTVQIVAEVLNAMIIFGKVEQNDEIAIECEMKIFISEEEVE